MKFASPVIEKAEALIKRIDEERAAVSALGKAIDARKLDGLLSAMEKIKSLGLTNVPEMAQAEALKKRLEEEAVVTKELESASGAKNLEQLNAALSKAATIGLENDAVKQAEDVKKNILAELAKVDEGKAQAAEAAEKERIAKIEAEREKKVQELQANLRAAAQLEDEAKIAEAKRKVLEAGVGGAEVEQLLGAAKKLGEQKEVITALSAACETAENKMQNTAGIVPADIKRLTEAITKAKAAGITPADAPELQKAIDMESKMTQQIEAQKALVEALAQDDFEVLVKAMGFAQDLDMHTETLQQVIDKVKEIDSTRVHDNGPRVETELDEDEFERLERRILRQPPTSVMPSIAITKSEAMEITSKPPCSTSEKLRSASCRTRKRSSLVRFSS